MLFTPTLYGWRFLQPRARWATAAGTMLFTLPRLMSGADWLSEILCGSTPLGLITVGLYDGLGLAPVIDRPLVPLLEHWLRRLTPPRLRLWLDQQPGPRTGAAASERPPVPSR